MMISKILKYLIFFLFVFLFSCKNSDTNNKKITGFWSVVINDSIYMESLIENNKMYLFGFDYYLLGPREIKILNDSIYLYDKNDKTAYKLLQKEDNKIDLISKKETLRFFRIDSTMTTFFNLNNEDERLGYKLDFYNRKNELFKINVIYNYDSIKEIESNEEILEIIEFRNHPN